METCKGKVCPRLSADGVERVCIEHRCAFYQSVLGLNPQTGEHVNAYDCAVRWHNFLLMENGQQVRQLGAAVESARNEARKDASGLGNSILQVADAVSRAVTPVHLEIPARQERLPLLARLRLAFRG